MKKSEFPDKKWLDSGDYLPTTKHWIVLSLDTKQVIAAARLTWHVTLDDDYRDVQLWKRSGKHLPLPVCDLGRLVVNKTHRSKGIAQMLNVIRIKEAKLSGAKSIMVNLCMFKYAFVCIYVYIYIHKKC